MHANDYTFQLDFRAKRHFVSLKHHIEKSYIGAASLRVLTIFHCNVLLKHIANATIFRFTRQKIIQPIVIKSGRVARQFQN